MAEFYDHPSGKLHIRAAAGGGNSEYDGVATDKDKEGFPLEYARYMTAKRAAIAAIAAAEHAAADKQAEDAALSGLQHDSAALAEHVAEIESHHKQEE